MYLKQFWVSFVFRKKKKKKRDQRPEFVIALFCLIAAWSLKPRIELESMHPEHSPDFFSTIPIPGLSCLFLKKYIHYTQKKDD
jgi:hypothetical protein